MTDVRRTDVREHVYVHVAVCVGQCYRGRAAVVDRGEVDASAVHKACAERHAFRTVVVSADDEYMSCKG